MVAQAFLIAILGGAALAMPYVVYARGRRMLYAIGLVIAAIVYVVFAAVAGISRALAIELAGVAVFGVIAFAGVRWSPLLLAFGWLGHVAWDLLLHPVHSSEYAPWWYPVLCIGFDIFVAGAIFSGVRKNES